ncbi:hypothetical protein KBP53_07750 [Corynebacterium genitalium ATCC 33030]|nr:MULTISPECIES: hypothetical protein [Corynebacterium]MCQ4617862.1 hypothetical protein [Corynebacterium pseudogenitalium]MCQ4624608.1 hypothetical protein [Corynebacterium sp. CCUG 69979]UUA88807.1 hypothetical protein KBP53_07750 [Corynebacterium genitalium ATCC 33030]
MKRDKPMKAIVIERLAIGFSLIALALLIGILSDNLRLAAQISAYAGLIWALSLVLKLAMKKNAER